MMPPRYSKGGKFLMGLPLTSKNSILKVGSVHFGRQLAVFDTSQGDYSCL